MTKRSFVLSPIWNVQFVALPPAKIEIIARMIGTITAIVFLLMVLERQPGI